MNKKFIKIIISLIMILLIILPVNITASSKKMLGDINGDQIINSSDLLLLLRHISSVNNNTHSEWKLTDERFKLADLNEDNEISIIDILYLQRYIVANTNSKIKEKHPSWTSLKEIDINENEPHQENPQSSDSQVVEVKNIKLNKTNIKLDMSGTKKSTIIATVTPANATNKNIEWSTSDSKIVTVIDGKITAKKNGKATITALCNGKKATCSVTVITSPKSISINKKSVTIDISTSKKITLKGKILPNESSNKKITWHTSNKNIATVTNGVVRLKKAGNVTITATSSNGKKATCKITVKDDKITGGEAIAQAAVKLACTAYPDNPIWSDEFQRIYNNKTKAYVLAKESLIPSSATGYASCDIGAATAIRYSKVDKNFEWNTVPKQWTYMLNSKYWNRVGSFNGTSTSNLKPGDVLVGSHIMIYTGNTVVRKRFSKSSANLYEASQGQFYPRLTLTTSRIGKPICGIYRHVNYNKKIYNKIL